MINAIVKGSELTLEIESLAFGGKGVARKNNFVVFVNNTLPGQKVRVMVYKKHRGYAEARPLEILRDSPHVVDSLCGHFPICGGCSTQNLDYKEQVNQKKKQVEDLYIRQAGIDDFSVNKVIVANIITVIKWSFHLVIAVGYLMEKKKSQNLILHSDYIFLAVMIKF